MTSEGIINDEVIESKTAEGEIVEDSINSNKVSKNAKKYDNIRWYSDEIDRNKIYEISLKDGVSFVGRTLALDLKETIPTLPGNIKGRHMTLVFRRKPRFSEKEASLVNDIISSFIKAENDGSNKVTFTIEEWGNESVLVKGNLEKLNLYVKDNLIKSNFMFDARDQRLPHIKLFNQRKAQKNGSKNGRRRNSSKNAKNDKNYKNDFRNGENSSGNESGNNSENEINTHYKNSRNGRFRKDRNNKNESKNKSKEFWYSSQIVPGKVYFTHGIIVTTGRALAFDLEDAQLPGNVKGKHATIFFRNKPRFTEDDISLLNKLKRKWVSEKMSGETSGNNNSISSENSDENSGEISFSIDPWGNFSVLIEGELCELIERLRKDAAHLSEDEQRLPHAALFRRNNGNNNRRRH